MTLISDLIAKLDSCESGRAHWKNFEDVCTEILELLFVPPLNCPIPQPRTYSGTNRRDAVLPNRNFDKKNNWGILLKELNARMVLCEFKNYDKSDVGQEEVNQTNNYLTGPMGKLALMICSKEPDNGAHIRRNTIFSQYGKVILFLTKSHLNEMLYIKERGEDPSDLIIDLVEKFYLQHE